MKIILSPSKTMNLKEKQLSTLTQPLFIEESEMLRNILKQDTLEDIKKRFKTSDKLSQQVFQFYQKDFSEKAAIETYTGQVYANLDYQSLTEEKQNYANQHLRILSALYGILKPTDAIKPYRLDFMVPFPQDLYAFWETKILQSIDDEELIINLASNEFSKLIPEHKLFQVNFVNEQGRSQSTMAKKARGNFARKIVENQCENLDDLKAIKLEGFKKIAETKNSLTFQIQK